MRMYTTILKEVDVVFKALATEEPEVIKAFCEGMVYIMLEMKSINHNESEQLKTYISRKGEEHE